MTDRPILFSAPMVRAILDGRKTQTRRIVKLKDHKLPLAMGYWRDGADGAGKCVDPNGPVWSFGRRVPGDPHNMYVHERVGCPYGQPGDRLWVRETWCHEFEGGYLYRADDPTGSAPDFVDGDGNPTDRSGWKPSIHMPRKASRITLEITGVRVERLNAISENDAKAEGIEPLFTDAEITARPELGACRGKWKNYLWHGHFGQFGMGNTKSAAWQHQFSGYDMAIGSYSSLWELINGPGSWAANPWVWVVEFKRVMQ